jgi:putative PIN family toxin of toxin-antitoxin system
VDFLRIFFDANILISAIVYNGNELKTIFRSLEEGHALVISEHIEEEILRVMLDKFPEHSRLFHEFISLAGFEIVQKEKYINKINDYKIVRDKHDRHVLACASSTKCELIITGDKDLLTLKKYDNVQIIKAKDLIVLFK